MTPITASPARAPPTAAPTTTCEERDTAEGVGEDKIPVSVGAAVSVGATEVGGGGELDTEVGRLDPVI